MKIRDLLFILIFFAPFSLFSSSPFLLRYYYPSGRNFFVEPVRSHPVSLEGKFIYTVGSSLYIVDPYGGKVKHFALPEPSSFSPLPLGEGKILLVGDKGGVYSFSLTGTHVNRIGGIHDIPLSDPFRCGKGSFIFLQGRGGIYRIALFNGKTETIPFQKRNRLYWGNYLPACYEDKIYSFAGNELLIINPEDFVVIKKTSISSGHIEVTGKKYYGSPFPVLVEGNRIVVATPSKTFFLKNDVPLEIKDLKISAASMVDGFIFLSGIDGTVYKFTPDGTISEKFRVSKSDNGLAPVVKVGEDFYATGDDEFLIVFNEKGKIYRYYTTTGVYGRITLLSPFKFAFLSRSGSFYILYFLKDRL